MADEHRHYHIHSPMQHRFNPDIPRSVGISKDHVVKDEDPKTSYSGHFNPDIDYVDMTPPPAPTVIKPSFGEWFGSIADIATIRSALNSGGATGNNGLNHTYYVATDTLPTHPTSIQNQPATCEPGQPVAAE